MKTVPRLSPGEYKMHTGGSTTGSFARAQILCFRLRDFFRSELGLVLLHDTGACPEYVVPNVTSVRRRTINRMPPFR